jgi:hypothetical protein
VVTETGGEKVRAGEGRGRGEDNLAVEDEIDRGGFGAGTENELTT